MPGYEFEGGRSGAGHSATPGPRGGHDAGDRDGSHPVYWTEPDDETRSFRYTPVVSQPVSVPPRPGDEDRLGEGGLPSTGFEFDDQEWYVPPPGTGPFGAIPFGDNTTEPTARRPASANQERTPAGRAARTRAAQSRAARARAARARATQSPAEPSSPRDADGEWASLLRSLLPEPIQRRWSSEFRAGLSFRGWGLRVVIPILATVVFALVIVMINGASRGTSGPTPSTSSLGYPPATLAGNDFTGAAGGRGIDQSLARVASDGSEIVAVGSQSGARIARAQFFVSLNDGKTWTLGTVRSASGGPPPPGHAATFVTGGNGAWIAAGPGRSGPAPTAGPGRSPRATGYRCSRATTSARSSGPQPVTSPSARTSRAARRPGPPRWCSCRQMGPPGNGWTLPGCTWPLAPAACRTCGRPRWQATRS